MSQRQQQPTTNKNNKQQQPTTTNEASKEQAPFKRGPLRPATRLPCAGHRSSPAHAPGGFCLVCAFVACCWLFVGCCLLFVCCVLLVVCWLLFVVCCLFAVWCLVFGVCLLIFVLCVVATKGSTWEREGFVLSLSDSGRMSLWMLKLYIRRWRV